MSCWCCGREDDLEGVRSNESQRDTPPQQLLFGAPASSQVIHRDVDEADVQAVRSWREQRFNRSFGAQNDAERPPRAPGTEFMDHAPPPPPPVQIIRTNSSDSFKDKLQLSSEAAELWKKQGEIKQNLTVDEKDIANIVTSIEFDSSKSGMLRGTPRQPNEHNQTLYLSSSSSDEDDVYHQSPGPVDLDEESAVISRPGHDDGDSKPTDSHSSPCSSEFRHAARLPPPKEAKHPAPSTSPTSSGRLTANSSKSDDDELDAIVAAIEQSQKPVDSPPSVRKVSQKTPPYLIPPSAIDSPPVHFNGSHGMSEQKDRKARSSRSVSPSDQSHGSMSTSNSRPHRSRSSVPSSPSQRRRERSLSRSRRSQSPSDLDYYVARITPPSSSSSPPVHRNNRKTSLRCFPPVPIPDSSTFPAHDRDDTERLSDVSDSVDADAKQRYLMACRILKSTLIEKGSKLDPDEKSFLAGLLGEASPSEAQVSAVSSAMGALQRGDQRGAAAALADASWVEFESEGVGQTYCSQDKPTTQPEIDKQVSRTTAFSQALSSFFSRRNEEDYPFKILGTYGFRPTVLTPTIMEALRGFFPCSVADGNFLLKYALKRDGADLPALLVKIQSYKFTVLAVETTDGHVFGAFCSTPWRAQSSWFGSRECFLWRLKNPRWKDDKAQFHNYDHDNEMEVYPHTGNDDMIQYCTGKAIAVGGCAEWREGEQGSPYRGEPAGIGFLIDGDLLGGETSSCATFANPRLGDRSTQKTEFDIEALEVWAVTP